jgi:hypothetical protein
MSRQPPALLLGNGVNLLTRSRSAATWKSVLEDLADFAGHPQIMDHAEYKPFTLIYEEVIAFRPDSPSKSAELQVKERVAEKIQAIPRNDYHGQFEGLGCRHILTTNYDYNLGDGASPANLRPESRYSVFRRDLLDECSFWRIHGEVDRPQTIMLGHEQYAGALEKMRGYVTGSSDVSSPFSAGRSDFDAGKKHYSWVDVFLRDDIHILGFSLDYTEIELWWLLSYKARLKRQNPASVGDTYFYLFTPDRRARPTKAKLSLLESLSVHPYVQVIKKNDYRPAYDWALKLLRTLISGTRG